MPEQRVIFGRRGGKSFQSGYDAGYAQCKLDISNEPTSTDEMNWLRKLRIAILGGKIEIRFVNVNPADETNLRTFAQNQAVDYVEQQTARHIQHLLDQIEHLRQQQASGWIPCSERLPEDDTKPYDITAEVDAFGQKMLVTDVLRYYGDGRWEEFEGSDEIDYRIVAWKDRPSPWSGEVGRE